VTHPLIKNPKVGEHAGKSAKYLNDVMSQGDTQEKATRLIVQGAKPPFLFGEYKAVRKGRRERMKE
jgi:hypothetical protein